MPKVSAFFLSAALSGLFLVVPLVYGIGPVYEPDFSSMRKEAARLREGGKNLWKTHTAPKQNDALPAEPRKRPAGHEDAADQANEGMARPQDLPRDEAGTVLQLTQAAEQGDAHAQCVLGVMYATGQEVEKDDAKAAQWLEKAAGQGFAMAQYGLGVLFALGQGVPKNDAFAVQWYEKAAEQKNADAQYALGWMYAQGRGVARDEVMAVRWCMEAAKQGVRTQASCQQLRRAARVSQ